MLAAALSVQLEVEVRETGSFAVHTALDIPRDRSNLVVRGFERLHSADAFEFEISSEIPLSGGLGSSAAAVLAGLMAADHMFELDEDLLALGTELEGHPDNVAAALEGGFVVCSDGRAARFEPPMGLEAVVAIPHQGVSTEQARAALPATVPLRDAVFNVAHASTLILGLATADWELIASGLDDRLHQPARSALYPRSIELLGRARELGALGATISGAGPSVLVWCHYEQTGRVLEALQDETHGWADMIRVTFESHGADVREL